MLALLDVVCLDVQSLEHYPSAMAAAALCVVFGRRAQDLIFQVSGYTLDQLAAPIELFQIYDSYLPLNVAPPNDRFGHHPEV